MDAGSHGTGDGSRHGVVAVWIAIAVATVLAAVRFVFYPIHAQGTAQSFTGFLIASAHIVNLPGQTLAVQVAAEPGHHPTTVALLAAILVSAAFYGLAAYVLLNVRHCAQDGSTTLRQSSVVADGTGIAHEDAQDGVGAKTGQLLSRRAVIRRSVTRGLLLAGGGGVAGAFVYSTLIEPSAVGVSMHKLHVRDLPPTLMGLRIVQLSDLHHGPWNSIDFITWIVNRTNQLLPDLVVITGDYVHSSPAYIAPVARVLGGLKATIGVVGVLGNHDWWEDAVLTRKALVSAGVRLVDNQRLFVDAERKLVSSAARGLCIAGVGDYWEDTVDLGTALGGVPTAMPRLVLSHNPDVAEDREVVMAHMRVDLMLSGHTHGGQVRLPVLGTPVVPSRYGDKYASGFVEGPAFPVYVSRGLGNAVLPVRFRVPPEIAVFELIAS